MLFLGRLIPAGMIGTYTSSRDNFVSPISLVSACIVAIGGAVALFGWAMGLPSLYRFSSGIPPMFPWTAVCVTAVGVALIGRNLPNGVASKMISAIGSFVAVAIMTAVLFEYATGWDLRFDQLLFAQKVEQASTSLAGRPSPQSAVAFIALGLALLGALREGKSRRLSWVIEGMTLLSVCITLMVFFGYAYSVDAFFSVPHLKYIGMSPFTATYMLLACIAALIAEPTSWTVRILSRKSLGGTIARTLLPLFILIPMGLGLLRIEAERAGWITHETGTSLMALAQVLIGVSMLFWVAHMIDRAATLEKIVTMSCVSKRVLRDGEWIAIEKYLHEQHHIQVSHGMTPDEAEAWLNDAKDYLAREKERTKIAS